MTSDSRKKVVIAVVLAAVALVFFAAYSFLVWSAPLRFASPDENANWFFVRAFKEDNRLWAFDDLNLYAGGLIHPRSTKVIADVIVPGGFLGLPVIYGSAAKFLGLGTAPYYTAALAALAALAFGLTVRRLLGGRGGLIAGLLLLVQPVWWYEANRAFMPNTLFASLLIFSAFFLFTAPMAGLAARKSVKRILPPDCIDGIIGGLLLGLALAVRLSEAQWIAIGLAAALVFAPNRGFRYRLAAAAVGALFALSPFLLLNQSVYGSAFATGYAQAVTDVPVAEMPEGRGAALLGPLRPILFPLGFAPRTALANFWTYGVSMFWWWSALVVLAAAFWLAGPLRTVGHRVLSAVKRERRKEGKTERGGHIDNAWLGFIAAAAMMSAWLIMMYGSWSIQDNPDPEAVTIGSSYLRYWLPIFVASTVPVAWLGDRLLGLVDRRYRATVGLGIFMALAAASGASVLYAPQEGLLAVRRNLYKFDSQAKTIMALTEPRSLIVVDRADKFVFPDRPVIYPLRDEKTYEAVSELRARTPVYYWGITFSDRDLRYLNEEKLPPLGLTISRMETVGEESLYRFEQAESR
jgi:hypothetical protein